MKIFTPPPLQAKEGFTTHSRIIILIQISVRGREKIIQLDRPTGSSSNNGECACPRSQCDIWPYMWASMREKHAHNTLIWSSKVHGPRWRSKCSIRRPTCGDLSYLPNGGYSPPYYIHQYIRLWLIRDDFQFFETYVNQCAASWHTSIKLSRKI